MSSAGADCGRCLCICDQVEGHLRQVSIFLLALCITAGNSSARKPLRPDERAAKAEDDGEAVYSSAEYKFSVRIPRVGRVYKPSPPAPQHGISVDLSGTGPDRLWINGEYDALMLGSVEALAGHTADQLAAQYHLKVVKNVRTSLDGLEARDVVLEGSGNQEIRFVRFVLALRPMTKGLPIVYTVGLQQKTKGAVGDNSITRVLKSFSATRP